MPKQNEKHSKAILMDYLENLEQNFKEQEKEIANTRMDFGSNQLTHVIKSDCVVVLFWIFNEDGSKKEIRYEEEAKNIAEFCIGEFIAKCMREVKKNLPENALYLKQYVKIRQANGEWLPGGNREDLPLLKTSKGWISCSII